MSKLQKENYSIFLSTKNNVIRNITQNPKAQNWSGVIVCDSGNGIYPSAVFYEENGACGFRRTTPFTSLSLFVNAIFDIFGKLCGLN